MPLSALTWRKLPPKIPAAQTAEGMLNAIWAALDPANTVYADGTTRTAGSGTAWTFSRYQNVGVTEAVYGTPPAAAVSSMRVILAGRAGAATPTMRSPDTFQTGTVHAGLSKGVAGAYNAWDAANPFADGSFSGYSRNYNTIATTINLVQVYESQEAIAVAYYGTLAVYGVAMIGALWDPEHTLGGEATLGGRLLGFTSCGSDNALGSIYGSPNMFRDIASNGSPRTFYFNPGLATTAVVLMDYQQVDHAVGTYQAEVDLSPVVLPIFFYRSSPQRFVGRIREAMLFQDAFHGGTVKNPDGSVKGHIISGSITAVQDAFVLLT